MPDSETNPPPEKRATGKQATRFFLDKNQIAFINSYISALEAEVFKHDPHFEGRTKPISDWGETTAQEIMNSPLFVNLPATSGELRPAWIKTIKRRFSNHIVNNMAPKFFKKFYFDHKDCGSAPLRGASSRVPESRTEDILHSAMAIFHGDQVNPRELYAEEPETKKLLEDKMREISVESPTLVGGGLRNKALAILWQSLKESDRTLWEDAAKALLHDIPMNRTHFPVLIGTHLQRLCKRGVLGTIYTSFSYAFRNENDNVEGLTLYVGYDGEREEAITTIPTGSQDRATGWLDMANEVLPRRALPSVFPLTDDGVPCFPIIDVAKSSLEELAGALTKYLIAVWGTSHNGSTSVPWDDLVLKPDYYYDTKLFSTPVGLHNPQSYLNDPVAIYKLIDFFRNTSTPFQFRHANDNNAQPQHPPRSGFLPADPQVDNKRSAITLSDGAPKSQEGPLDFGLPRDTAGDTGPPGPAPNTAASSGALPLLPAATQVKKRGRPKSIKKTAPAPVATPPAPVNPANATPTPTPVNPTPAPVNAIPIPAPANATPATVNPTPPVPVGNATPSPTAVTRRASTRKRKASITKPETANKKRRPGYFYEDGNGGFLDGEGNPVDSNGDRIST